MKFELTKQHFRLGKLLLRTVMKTFIFLCCTIAFAFTPNLGHTQDVDITIDKDRTMTVKQVFKLINKQANYKFIYRHDLVKNAPEISLKKGVIKAKTLLQNCLAPINFTYEFTENNIVVVKRKPKTTTDIDNLRASNENVQSEISGTVTDESGGPLPGASVLVKGTTNGTQTDFDGNFTIAADSNVTLVISYIGFATVEIPVNGQTQLAVGLKESASSLDEVVLVGYGSVKKSDLTGAVASVNADDIKAVPVSSIDQALQGRASGVSVIQNSGIPGAATTIRIRGTNSIQGGNNPLFIVDGFPITGGINSINPADIENIEILKDASSTAIYGARGTNGVIIITTKKGKNGKFSIDFDSYYGIQEQSKKIDLLNSKQFVQIANERAVNDGESELFFPDPSSVTTDTDWIDELFDASPIQSHTITLTAGNERVKTSQSFNYFNQDGILKNSGFERATFRNNTEVKMSDWLTVANSLILSRSDRQFSGDGGNRAVIEAHIAPPTIPVYDADGNYGVVNGYPFSPGSLDNPMKWINEYEDEILTTKIFDNFYGLFTLTPNLTFKSSIGIDYSTTQSKRYLSRLLLDGAPGGKAFRGSIESYSVLNENILNYNKEFGNHSINALVGYNWQTFRSTFIRASSFDFVTDLLGAEVLQDGASPQPPSSGNTEWGLASALGRINYSYKDKYLLTLTGRADWSSRFAKGNQRAIFPSVAAAWKVSKEGFMNDVDWLSDLKLRASWGKTGNQAVRPGQTFAKVGSGLVVLSDALGLGFFPGTPANPDLKWETTDQYDIGLDFGVLNNKVRFTLDYYYKKTTDLLAQVDLPPSVGFPSITQNIGSMENKGIEFSVDANVVSNDDLSWDTSFQISKNENKVLKLNRGADIFPSRVNNLISEFHIIREGLPLSTFYGFVNDGYDSEGQNKYLDFAGTDANGELVMEPDGQITDADRRVIGSPHPDFTFGFGNTFKYKNLSLNVFLEGAQGFDIVWGTKFQLKNSFSRGGNQLTEVLNSWTPSNTNNPSTSIISSTNDFKGSTEFIEDGSYIKIRTINLAYNIPTAKLSWLNSAQVYINAQNMFTFTKYSGYDPEVSGYADGDLRLGVDNNVYPSTKVVSMGIRVGI